MADGGGDIATLGVVVALNCEVTSVLINSETACMSMAALTGLGTPTRIFGPALIPGARGFGARLADTRPMQAGPPEP